MDEDMNKCNAILHVEDSALMGVERTDKPVEKLQPGSRNDIQSQADPSILPAGSMIGSTLEAAADEDAAIPPPPAPISLLGVSEPTETRISSDITRRLYLSHFLSTWNSRSFEFGAVLFLAAIYPGTLLYLSIYALVRSASAIIFSAEVGRSIDKRGRLGVLRFSIIGQRVAVILSCVGFYIMLVTDLTPPARDGIFAALILISCVEKNCSVMNLVSIERDWAVVIGGHHEPTLQKLNARMRRIDLICKLAGPLVISLVDGASVKVAILLTLGINVVSVSIEYIAIAQVFKACPELHLPRRSTTATQPTPPISDSSAPTNHCNPVSDIKAHLTTIYSTYILYLTHSTMPASFALSLLYLTVLSLSSQMTTYLLTTGYTPYTIALVRTLSVLFELTATFLAPRLMRRMIPIRAGLWFLSFQMATLAAGTAFFFAPPGHNALIGASGLVAATILSRVGLWGFDLCAQVIVQSEVTETERGAFSTTESSFQNLFELLSFVCTIIWARPEQFRWPVLVSVCAVYGAGGIFGVFARKRRGHLMHLTRVFGKRGVAVRDGGYDVGGGDGRSRGGWR